MSTVLGTCLTRNSSLCQVTGGPTIMSLACLIEYIPIDGGDIFLQSCVQTADVFNMFCNNSGNVEGFNDKTILVNFTIMVTLMIS